MVSNKVCRIAFRQALQDKLGYTISDIEKLREEYFDTIKEVNAQYNKYKASDAYIEAVKQMMDSRRIKNLQKRKMAYLNLEKRLSMEQFIMRNYPDDYKTGVDRFMQLVDYHISAKRDGYFADFIRRITGRDGSGEDYMNQLSSGKYDALIRQELFYMDNPEAAQRDKVTQYKDGSFTGDPIAYKLADIIYKMQRIAVQDAIDAGADIKLIPGYMVRQTHSQEKFLASKYGDTIPEKRETWKKTILEYLDIDKTFGDLPQGITPDEILNGIWENIIRGQHYKYLPEEISFIPGRNISKRAAAERKLIFKDGLAAHKYNELYGADNLREAFVFQLSNMAATSVLLNYMGSNPRYNFENVFRSLRKRAFEEGHNKNTSYMESKAGRVSPSLTESADNQLAELLGETNAPGSVSMAKINSLFRQMNNVAYLGGSFLTAFSDLSSSPTIAHLQGRGTIGSILDNLKGLTGTYKKELYTDILDSIGFTSDAFLGQIAQHTISKFGGEVGLSRRASYITQQFFILNGLRWWTDSIRSAQTIGMARDLAKLSNVSFDNLNVNMKDFLKRFDISKKDWDILRQYGISQAKNGDYFMLNENISRMNDTDIAKLFDIKLNISEKTDSIAKAKAARIYKAQIKKAREGLADKLQTALLASGMEAVLLPTVTEKATAHRGTNPGTLTGELLRHLTQFKQFPLALYNMILKGIYRESREAGPLAAAKTGALYIAGMFVTTYISMAIKDIFNNKTPRDISDPQTFMEVLVRSGALSLYGDLLLSDSSSSPYELLGAMGGPTFSSVSELAQIMSKAIHKGENVMDELTKFAIQRAPAIGLLTPATSILAYTNIFYFKGFLNYYIYDAINELFNPGYTARNRARLLKQGRDYIFEPKY